MSASTTSSKLSPVILEAMARTLSDHDLLRFMLSSKEAFNATLDALSTVDHINYHDQNFEGEPCVSFRMKRDDDNKISLNYITQSNPLFNFIVTYVKSCITKLELGELVAIEPWVLNSLMTSTLRQLTLGIVLPKDHQHLLKSLPNLMEIKYPNFDLFIANNVVPDSCKKISIDHIDFYDFEFILHDLKKFKPTKVEELSISEEKLFLNDYDEIMDDFCFDYWRIFLKFLLVAFPSLKTLNMNVSGRTDYPMPDILQGFQNPSLLLLITLPLHLKGNIVFNVLIPPHEWVVIHEGFKRWGITKRCKYEKMDADFEEGLKNRKFPRYFNSIPLTLDLLHNDNKAFLCGLHFYSKWEEYDFDTPINKVYNFNAYLISSPPQLDETESDEDDTNVEDDLDTAHSLDDSLGLEDGSLNNDLVSDDEHQPELDLINDLMNAVNRFLRPSSNSNETSASDCEKTNDEHSDYGYEADNESEISDSEDETMSAEASKIDDDEFVTPFVNSIS